MEAVDAVHTRTTVVAREREALVDVHAAVFAGESRATVAFKVVLQRHTAAAVGTRFCQANVHFGLALGAHEARHTLAPVSIHKVHAGASVQTRALARGQTIVFVHLTPFAGEPGRALALEAIDVQIDTRGPVQARIRVAVIHLRITVSPCIAFRASTLKTLRRVCALAVQTRLLRTGHSLLLAVASDPSLVALAAKG